MDNHEVEEMARPSPLHWDKATSGDPVGVLAVSLTSALCVLWFSRLRHKKSRRDNDSGLTKSESDWTLEVCVLVTFFLLLFGYSSCSPEETF